MKHVVIALSVALVGALLVIAFLLGQRSVGGVPVSPVQIVREIVSERAPGPPKAVPAAPVEEMEVPPAEPPAAGGEPPAAAAEAQAAPSESPPSGELAIERDGDDIRIVNAKPGLKSPDVERLAAYLNRVKALQVGPAGTSEESFAQQLLGEAMSGDVSGLNDLIRQTEAAQQQLKDIQPPAGAERHREKLQDLLSESAKLLSRERDALQRKDPEALSLLVANARHLQAKAKALEAEQEELAKKIK
jgi:hypothetical protein